MINCVFQQRIKKVLAVQSCSQAIRKTGRKGWMKGWMKGGSEVKKLAILSCTGLIILLSFYSCIIVLRQTLTSSISFSIFLPLSAASPESVVTFPLLLSSFHPFPPSYSCPFVFPFPSSSSNRLFPVIIFMLSIFHQLLLLHFHPLLLLLSLFLYMGNTRKPEKVEYFHPPIRFPLSSLR